MLKQGRGNLSRSELSQHGTVLGPSGPAYVFGLLGQEPKAEPILRCTEHSPNYFIHRSVLVFQGPKFLKDRRTAPIGSWNRTPTHCQEISESSFREKGRRRLASACVESGASPCCLSYATMPYLYLYYLKRKSLLPNKKIVVPSSTILRPFRQHRFVVRASLAQNQRPNQINRPTQQ